MEVDKYKQYCTIDFLKDRDFLRWQLLHSEEDDLFWNNIVEDHPTLGLKIEEAVKLFKNNLRFNDFTMSQLEISEDLISLQLLINRREKQIFRHKLLRRITAVAASIVILIVSLLFYLTNDVVVPDITTFAQTSSESNDLYSTHTKLILSENNSVALNNEESSIEYDNDAIKADDKHIHKEKSATYNQLIIPYGKRSKISFSDGTKAWVNAGTTLTYPSEFSQDLREIYLNGELYIEVAEDKSRPFVIRTSQMNIRVLGTKFNVSSYETDQTKSVVLMSGSVGITSEKLDKKIILKPNQMYSSDEYSYSVENVDANMYILWTQGLYHFESEKLENILSRLERHYGIEIVCDDAIPELKCSGKLDLKEDLSKLFDELSQALSIEFRQSAEGCYTIYAVTN